MVHWITLPDLSDYLTTLQLMEDRVNKVLEAITPETIFLVEHQEVYTAGSSAQKSELLNAAKIPVIYTGRGGKFTYHGPGQRVIYPILNLKSAIRGKDLRWYIESLQNWIIRVLAKLDVEAFTRAEHIGVWVRDSDVNYKIASIGVRIKRWVTYHGVAINISSDIEKFAGIVACGIEDCKMTSLTKLGVIISLQEFDHLLQEEFFNIFEKT